MYIHKTTFPFPDENNNGCEFSYPALHLAIGTDADFYFMSPFFFLHQYTAHFFRDRDPDPFSVQFSPLLSWFHFIPSRVFKNLWWTKQDSNLCYLLFKPALFQLSYSSLRLL